MQILHVTMIATHQLCLAKEGGGGLNGPHLLVLSHNRV
jgi:hypothetical protein